ncbi:MAG: hypothetical protein AB2392_21990 [Neobacillus sp.]
MVIIKKMMLNMFVITLLLIGGCSKISSKNKDEVEHFSTQVEALEHFIEFENIKGNIDLVTTTNSEILLVTHASEDTYFVGELKEDDEGFYAAKISASVRLGIGAAWELNTIESNEYTIFFDTNNEPNFIKFSNEEYFFSIVEGHTLSKNLLNAINTIKEVQTIKSN